MHMPSRTAKFVSAAFASVLAGVPLTTASNSAVPATGNCLSGPKDQAPQGSHWYYRIEHATQRHCWYLRDEHEKLSQTTSPNSPKAEPEMQHSIANARAELPLPQAHIEQETSAATGQPAPAMPANAPGVGNNQLAAPRDANTQQSAIASRWPEPSNIGSSANPGSAVSNSGAAGQSNSRAARLPAVAAVRLAAADSSSERQFGPAHMLMIVVLGALSIAGLVGSAIFRFAGTRPIGGRDMRGDPRAADDPNRRIAEMLARLSRTAAT
jgi:hypothetical protein